MQPFSQYSRGCIKHIYIAVSIGVFVCETGEVICYPWLPVKIYEHKNRKIYSSIVQCNIYKYINLMGSCKSKKCKALLIEKVGLELIFVSTIIN